jgi:hypothetical protein
VAGLELELTGGQIIEDIKHGIASLRAILTMYLTIDFFRLGICSSRSPARLTAPGEIVATCSRSQCV